MSNTQKPRRGSLDGWPDLDTMRSAPEKHDQDNPRLADQRSGTPEPSGPPDASGDDPFVAGSPDATGGFSDDADRDRVARPVEEQEGPSYERDQGPKDDNTGGSSDPNNSLSHADSG